MVEVEREDRQTVMSYPDLGRSRKPEQRHGVEKENIHERVGRRIYGLFVDNHKRE